MNKLVEVTRGLLVEMIIRGSIVVVDDRGLRQTALGNADYLTYMRSSAKPLQATAAVESGAVDAYGISESELAIMCGSHLGEDFHTEAVLSILAKIGCKESDLTLGVDYSLSKAIREQRLVDHVAPRKVYNNCSGKHACMLTLCRFMGWPIENYQDRNHPVQQLIFKTVAEYAELSQEDIVVGVDGCGVPVFGMPLYNMAVAYNNLANPSRLPEKRAVAAARLTAAMGKYPHMVSGTNQFCTELMRITKGRIIGKLGADGVYCSAIIGGPALALKIEDGNLAAIPPVMVAALSQLNWLNADELQQLEHFGTIPNINCQRDKVGEMKATFRLPL